MPTLRQELAELKRRMLALEARQILWRCVAAGNPGAPDSLNSNLADLAPTPAMLEAIVDLRTRCAECGERPEQIDIHTEDGVACANAWFPDGSEESVVFELPRPVRIRDARRIFEEALGVE
jgi:hypothetical protein